MSWKPIPKEELPKVAEALKNGGCVCCYKFVGVGHEFYCHDCDDGCGDECPEPATQDRATDWPSPGKPGLHRTNS